MKDGDYFGEASVIREMSAEHRFLWRSLFQASRPWMSAGMRVLDLGCGDGGMLRYLLRGDGDWPGCACSLALGIDRPEMDAVLRSAAASAGISGLPIVYTSASPESFPAQFDLALSHEVIYLLPDLRHAFRGLRTALRPGGVAVLVTGCHRENRLYDRWRIALAREGVDARDYGADDYVRALEDAGFERVDCGRLTLRREEYEDWVRSRGEPGPNPAWFPSSEEERIYYTVEGKLLLLAHRETESGP